MKVRDAAALVASALWAEGGTVHLRGAAEDFAAARLRPEHGATTPPPTPAGGTDGTDPVCSVTVTGRAAPDAAGRPHAASRRLTPPST
ncbi:hypothetical protein EYF80_038130 [Liparis tanakae]|uniref:Uncharacterized protein n=1 Tax=Liparis tanakae TaxID=230148 RepID=A0A4Z2GEF5_9TELE|nr:hypothetical protein EYF80_038130 [Liparis tanakae]